jgi:hypothetical protein
MKPPCELRDEAQRLLLEARRTTDEGRRKHLLARALTLATEAELAENKLATKQVEVARSGE